MPIVTSGQTLDIDNGESSNGVIVVSGGTQEVLFGGTVNGTVDSGGIDVCDPRGRKEHHCQSRHHRRDQNSNQPLPIARHNRMVRGDRKCQ
jgi:autotransporter passenger strand-loop-strand repeat protein